VRLASTPWLPALLLLGVGCAHSGAATPEDEEAAVAEGVRAAIRLYSPGREPARGPYCVEVNSSPGFERAVTEILSAQMGLDAVPMTECATAGKNAVLWVKVQGYEWMDWMTRAQLDVRGTVEPRPDQNGGYRLGWYRASFRASLGYRDGHWTTIAASDLGRI
jgi:hypothetical protein